MIRRTNGKIVWLESELLTDIGVIHGFFGRSGGVSQAPFASLNVKHQEQENQRAVDQNRLLVCQSLGLPPRQLQFASLCHGNRVVDCTDSDHGMTYLDSDSLVTTKTGQPLMLSVADCVPLIITDGQACALVHVGWRGADNEIVTNTIDQLVARGAKSNNLRAAMGPSIAGVSYEVGREVAHLFQSKYPESIANRDDQLYLDVGLIIRRQLESAGITQIDQSDIDVYEHNEEWFSARRGDAGRNAAIVAISTQNS